MTDPFSDDFNTNNDAFATTSEVSNTVSTAPAAPVVPAQDGKVVVTLKAGTDFSSPWIVIHAADTADALSQMQDENLKSLMDVTKRAGQFFSGGNSKPAAQPQQSTPPQQSAPGGESRQCSHGEMTFRSGVSKAGNTYKGFFCPERNRDAQCKPQFLK